MCAHAASSRNPRRPARSRRQRWRACRCSRLAETYRTSRSRDKSSLVVASSCIDGTGSCRARRCRKTKAGSRCVSPGRADHQCRSVALHRLRRFRSRPRIAESSWNDNGGRSFTDSLSSYKYISKGHTLHFESSLTASCFLITSYAMNTTACMGNARNKVGVSPRYNARTPPNFTHSIAQCHVLRYLRDESFWNRLLMTSRG
mmetsp:Transcript_9062/g.23847  ORF Transcript_9062/g.23847 Transcript_9062/m.23847 type:complete len:202 (-) Transcript_9062:1142-1747(-)